MIVTNSSTPSWFTLAERQIGTYEIEGTEHNPKIIGWHQYTTLKAEEDEIPWCSSFVCAMIEQSGLQSTKSAAARSWLGWGKFIKTPRIGCVVVLKRGLKPWQGHVGFYAGSEIDDVIWVLGGNQSNSVNIQAYDLRDKLSYRWPVLK